MPCGKETICRMTLHRPAHASWLESSLPRGFSCIKASYSKEKIVLHEQPQTLIHNVPKRFLSRLLVLSHLAGYCMWSRKPVPIIQLVANRTGRDSPTPTCTYPCTYSCTHVYMLIHMCTLVHIHVQSQAYAHTHMHTLVFSRTHIHLDILTYPWHSHSCVHTCTHTQISSNMHAHTLMWTHTFTLHFFIFFHLSFCRVQSQIWLSWAFTVLSQNHCLAPQLMPSLTPILVTHRVWSLHSVTSLYSEILSQNKLSNSRGGTGSGQSIHLYI